MFNNIDTDITNNPNWFSVTDKIQNVLKSVNGARERGYLEKREFLIICKEKSGRRTAELEQNSDLAIKKISELAYQLSDDPFAQISILASLKGVAVPRASCLLAWVFPEIYPVIDWRAWAVLHKYGPVESNPSGRNLRPNHWVIYLEVVKKLAKKHNQTPMEIDRWLWHAADKLQKIN